MLAQIIAVTNLSLRSLPQRIGASLVIVVGIGGVVGVLVSMLAMATGFTKTVNGSGRPDRVIVLRGGSGSELASSVSRDQAVTIKDAPGIQKDASGQPIASAESVVMVNLPRKGENTSTNVSLRGIEPAGFALRPEIQIVAGRNFEPGLREMIVGKAAQVQFQGLEIGNTLDIRGTRWTVVGVFASGGDSQESGLLANADTVMSSYKRPAYQSETVLLDNVESFDALKDKLTNDPTLSVDVLREPEYYARQSKPMSTLLFIISYVVGGIMAVGALFSALNTMYSAVSARTMEIATLRAIGFGALPVVTSVMVEALVLSVGGGLIGAGFAWLAFNGNAVSTLGGNFTQIVFPLLVTPGLLLIGVIWACVVGFIGGLFPAIRVARVPVAVALQG